MRSFARERSSSRRAPPIAASNPCAVIASSSVVVWSWFRDARGPVCSTTRPRSIESCTEAITSRSPSSATRRSRNSIASGKLCPVSTCISGNGKRPGRNAFSASRRSTIESLPPEKRSTGRSSSAATSRMMWIASDSSASRWVRRTGSRVLMRVSLCAWSGVQPALRLAGAEPTAFSSGARRGAVGAADRSVSALVERVDGEVALPDVRPDVVVRPVCERACLPELVTVVPAELRRPGAARRLVAADAGDPPFEPGERGAEGADLADRAAEVRVPLPEPVAVRRGLAPEGRALENLDPDPVASLDLAPDVVRLREEDVGVEREDPGLRLVLEQHVEEDALLLLERARERDLGVQRLEHRRDDPVGAQRLDVGLADEFCGASLHRAERYHS